MALINFVGFDNLSSATDIVYGPFTTYSSTNSSKYFININSPGRNSYGKSIILATNSGSVTSSSATLYKTFGGTLTTAIVGAAIKFPYGSGFSGDVYFGFSIGTTFQIYVRVSSNGSINVFKANGAVNIGSLPSGTVVPSNFNYYELQATIGSGTNGSFILAINGNTQLNITGINTSSDGGSLLSDFFITWNCIASGFAGTFAEIDDLYLSDTTGSAPYNTFLGDVRVITRYPTSNGTTINFTPLSGSNYQNINETSEDAGSTYNSSTTLNAIDSFISNQALPYNPRKIYGVQIRLVGALDTGSARNIAGYVKSGPSVGLGSNIPLSQTYKFYTNIFTTNPQTSASWTASSVNNAEFGYKLTT